MNKFKIPSINLDEYNYNLPQDRIPKFPVKERSKSKLLYADINAEKISNHLFENISELIPDNSSIVINSTKVIAARLNLLKQTGGKAEILLINPIKPSIDPQIVMQTSNNIVWDCIIGGKRINEGSILKGTKHNFHAEILKRYENKAIVEFNWEDDKSFGEILEEMGKIPLPPYLKRDTEEEDKERYQTIYAKEQGSVAAPTAGLHFTDNTIELLKKRNISFHELILHVGPGTFVPIESDVQNHNMHNERIFVNIETIMAIYEDLKNKKRIIATGTTSVRTLESLFWAGQKIISFGDIEFNENFIRQWDPYYQYKNIAKPIESIEALINHLNKKNITVITGETSLFIVPGYEFKLVDGIITNFHLPKSTLILLVAAFTGKELWRKIYNYALDNDYRFLSYGDSSLLLNSL
jgi:S-adenosylmethionine:tRNA ribosyltransferase-isomerase